MSDIKPVVALHPAIPRKEARAIAKQLAEAGYLPILADPAHIQVLDVLPIGQADALAHVAFGIVRSASMHERTKFADAVLDMMEEARKRRTLGEREDRSDG